MWMPLVSPNAESEREQPYASAEHLQRGGHRGGVRAGAVTVVHRADRPAHRRRHEHTRAERVDAAVAGERVAADEHREADEADDHARHDGGPRPRAARTNPVEQNHP